MVNLMINHTILMFESMYLRSFHPQFEPSIIINLKINTCEHYLQRSSALPSSHISTTTKTNQHCHQDISALQSMHVIKTCQHCHQDMSALPKDISALLSRHTSTTINVCHQGLSPQPSILVSTAIKTCQHCHLDI